MQHSHILRRKRRKAKRYSGELKRFTLESFGMSMESEHGRRSIAFNAGRWECSCEFFGEHSTCSHVMAVELLFAKGKGIELRGQE